LQIKINGNEPASSHPIVLWQTAIAAARQRLAECYVRGGDLIATYEETERQPVRNQIYWRFLVDESYCGLELIISAQTSRLDTSTTLAVASKFAWRPEFDGLVAIGPAPGAGWCCLEFADPSNLDQTVVNNCRLEHQLFPGHLEKGVIRRTRLRALFVPAATASATAAACYQQFLDAAPPLTA